MKQFLRVSQACCIYSQKNCTGYLSLNLIWRTKRHKPSFPLFILSLHTYTCTGFSPHSFLSLNWRIQHLVQHSLDIISSYITNNFKKLMLLQKFSGESTALLRHRLLKKGWRITGYEARAHAQYEVCSFCTYSLRDGQDKEVEVLCWSLSGSRSAKSGAVSNTKQNPSEKQRKM